MFCLALSCLVLHCSPSCIALLFILYCTAVCPVSVGPVSFILYCIAVCSALYCYSSCIALLFVPLLHCSLSCIALLFILYCSAVLPALLCCSSYLTLLFILPHTAVCPALHCCLSYIAMVFILYFSAICQVLPCYLPCIALLFILSLMHLSPSMQLWQYFTVLHRTHDNKPETFLYYIVLRNSHCPNKIILCTIYPSNHNPLKIPQIPKVMSNDINVNANAENHIGFLHVVGLFIFFFMNKLKEAFRLRLATTQRS